MENAAIDALKSMDKWVKEYQLTDSSQDIIAMCAFAERYNGLGYKNNNMVSPYVFSGTSVYAKGKYVADGKLDKEYVDKQAGVYILIQSVMNM